MNILELDIDRSSPVMNTAACRDVYKIFEQNPNEIARAVVNENYEPVGIVTKYAIERFFSFDGGEALFGPQAIEVMMRRNPFKIASHMPLDTALDGLTHYTNEALFSAFLVVDPRGKYLGFGQAFVIINALLRARENMVAKLKSLNKFLESQVEEREMAEAKAKKLANTDPLTGIANRRLFLNRFDARVKRTEPSAVVFIDLDKFKAINDTHGHSIGDAVLTTIAKRLEMHCNPDDLARLGGDEFGMIIDAPSSKAGAIRFAESVRDDLLKPIQCAKTRLRVGASIGIARFPQDSVTSSSVLHAADMAMLRSKRSGGGVSYYDSKLDADDAPEASLEDALRHAVRNQQISFAFQPIYDLSNSQPTNYEVLARWPAAAARGIGPAEFVPIAERLGLIDEMFWSIFNKALRHPMAQEFGYQLSFNVSPLQFENDDFGGKLLERLKHFGVDPSKIELEITETSKFLNLDKTTQTMNEMAKSGIRFSIDDFGTGHSSLKLLQKLPLSRLKIDQSFIETMLSDRQSRTIVDSAVYLAKSLGLKCVAEGVEDDATLKALRELDCEMAQGYLLGRPNVAKLQIDVNAKRTGNPTLIIQDAG